MELEKWVVGAEYDEVALARLKRALSDLQYVVRDQWSGMAGSQDIQHWTAAGPRGQLTFESETYMGLSVEGFSSLVSELQSVRKNNLRFSILMSASGRKPALQSPQTARSPRSCKWSIDELGE